jgi:hypothetical protein
MMASPSAYPRRARYVGEPIVPLNDLYPDAVFFVYENMPGAEPEIRGTGFIMLVPDSGWYQYAVTAAHVVRPLGTRSLIRVKCPGGALEYLAVQKWMFHPTADVAVAPIEWGALAMAQIPATAADMWWPKREFAPALGDDVYFIGLLRNMEAMEEESIPMVRSGTIGRMNQTRCKLKISPTYTQEITGHLIDCRSYQGMSGSPCFVQESRIPEGGAETHGNRLVYPTLLLGLISAHFDDSYPIAGASFRVPVHTGVAIVTPAIDIIATLNEPELVTMRKEANEKRKAAREPLVATPDVTDGDPAEFMRFRAMTQRLMGVSKAELDEKRAEDQQ